MVNSNSPDRFFGLLMSLRLKGSEICIHVVFYSPICLFTTNSCVQAVRVDSLSLSLSLSSLSPWRVQLPDSPCLVNNKVPR